ASLAISNGAGSVRNVADGFRSMPRPAMPIPPIARHGVVSGRHANVKLVQRRVANSAMVKVKHVHEKKANSRTSASRNSRLTHGLSRTVLRLPVSCLLRFCLRGKRHHRCRTYAGVAFTTWDTIHFAVAVPVDISTGLLHGSCLGRRHGDVSCVGVR